MRVALTMLVALGCGASQPPPQPSQVELGSTHTAPPGTGLPDNQPGPLAELPAPLLRLTASIAALDVHGEAHHAELAAALAALEDALPIVATPNAVERDTMARAIEHLETSPFQSKLHADDVRTVLETATSVMGRGGPRARSDVEKYTRSVIELAVVVRKIDPERPLLQQQSLAVTALEAAARVLYIAVGIQGPFNRVAG